MSEPHSCYRLEAGRQFCRSPARNARPPGWWGVRSAARWSSGGSLQNTDTMSGFRAVWKKCAFRFGLRCRIWTGWYRRSRPTAYRTCLGAEPWRLRPLHRSTQCHPSVLMNYIYSQSAQPWMDVYHPISPWVWSCIPKIIGEYSYHLTLSRHALQ